MSDEPYDRVGALERRVQELETAVRLGKNRAFSPPDGVEETKSPREFLLSVAPETDNDKALAAGYYLEILSGKALFGLDDLKRFYGQAKETAPRNPSLPPFLNVKKGYFREVEKSDHGGSGRTRWALTNSGIARIESVLKKRDGT